MKYLDLQKYETDKFNKIIKKNGISLIVGITIIFIITISIGIYIDIEFKNLWYNYNIMLNSILERSRSFYLGFNDGTLQFHSCDEQIKSDIFIKLSDYLSKIPNIVYSFPFSLCISNFNQKYVLNNDVIFQMSNFTDQKTDSSLIFSKIIENIEGCMRNILSVSLAQESTFLLQPIIDSKKQLWSIHRKMVNFTKESQDALFGPKSLICNYFMIFDLEGGPRVTGVILNDTVYQAPLFDIGSTSTVSINEINSSSFISGENKYNEILVERAEEKELNVHELLSKSSELNNYGEYLDGINKKISFLEEYDVFPEMNHELNKTTNREIISENHSINSFNSSILSEFRNEKIPSNSRFSGMRTIYVPTSLILSNIEVFTDGIKELERNANKKFEINITTIHIFTSIMVIITLSIILFIYIPLTLVEKEKFEEIFSSHGFLLEERYKYFITKYNYEVCYSQNELYSLIHEILNLTNKITDDQIKEIGVSSARVGLVNQSNNQINDIFLIYKQLIGVVKYNNCSIIEISHFASYCLGALTIKSLKSSYFKEISWNSEFFIELIILLSERYSIPIELTERIVAHEFSNTNYQNFFIIYVTISTIIYSIIVLFGSIEKIIFSTEGNLIKFSIRIPGKNICLENNSAFSEILSKSAEKYKNSKKNYKENFEEYIIENDLLDSFLKEGKINVYIQILPQNELLVTIISRKLNNKKNNSKKIFGQNFPKEKICFALFLDQGTSAYKRIVEEECSDAGIRLEKIDISNISSIKSEIIIIFIEKKVSNGITRKISEIKSMQGTRQIVICLLEDLNGVLNNCETEDSILNFSLENLHYKQISPSSCEVIENIFRLYSVFEQSLNSYQENGHSNKLKIVQTVIRGPEIRSKIQKIIILVTKYLSLQQKGLHSNILLQDIYYVLKNNFQRRQLSANNYCTNSIFVNFQATSITRYKLANTMKYELPQSFRSLRKRGFPFEFLKLIISFHSRPILRFNYPNKTKTIHLQKKGLHEYESTLNLVLNNLPLMSIEELTIEINVSIYQILLKTSKKTARNQVNLLMEVWRFIVEVSQIERTKQLQFYGPHLVLHSLIVFNMLIDGSIVITEEIISNFDLILALLISFMAIPFCKMGISSDVITMANSSISMITNDILPMENYVCSILINFLSSPIFSNLFDDFERCKKFIRVMIFSLDDRISNEIKKWINFSHSTVLSPVVLLHTANPIIYQMVGDSESLFASILFNTSKL
ncbi:putative integral membrane protein [Cryptosporidium felis]|nr:putative integral membrane protein [Cryptosporidium felis]